MSVGSSGILGIVDVVKTKTEAVVSEFQDLSAQVQLLDASINAIQGVGEVITAFPLGRAFYNLNEEYVVQGENKQDWSLTLSAGTYMFVFTPKAYLVSYDGSTPIWSNTNCNCNFIIYKLGDKELRFSVFDDLSVPIGNVGVSVKNFGNQTMIFTFATETTLGLTAEMSAPEIGTIVLDPTLYGYTEATIEYVKLA